MRLRIRKKKTLLEDDREMKETYSSLTYISLKQNKFIGKLIKRTVNIYFHLHISYNINFHFSEATTTIKICTIRQDKIHVEGSLPFRALHNLGSNFTSLPPPFPSPSLSFSLPLSFLGLLLVINRCCE